MSRAEPRAEKLAEYQRKRHFQRTPEPRGESASAKHEEQPTFVVQKHAASHLHYDFRLEHAGVLWSWAVPKGPSLRTGERRLAMRTEDHPLEYANFEGTIPQGEYGGGHVLVWDRGTWSPEADADKQMQRGRLSFTLDGEKLRGRFHLVRSGAAQARERWLLFKGNDADAADVDIITERPESVLSGKTIEQVTGPIWHSDRAPETKPKKAAKRTSPARKTAASTPRKRASKTNAVSNAESDAVLQAVSKLRLGFALTNLDKVLYPKQGLRKAHLIAYLAAVAPRMLPHVANRPLVLVRCPQGQAGKCFYQKNVEDGVPDAIRTQEITESTKSNHYAYVKDVTGLAALAQLGVLEVHLWGCHVDKVEQPDLFVFDLDPDEALPWTRVVDAAQALRERLNALKLGSFVKTTGGKGLHVVVPVVRKWSWAEHKAIAYAIAADLARNDPSNYVLNMRKQQRKGKIFIDYLRNGRGATAIAPYSTRAREGALVATPLSWQELAQGVRPEEFDIGSVLQRLQAQRQDPWASFFRLRQRIPTATVRALVSAAKRAKRA
jgi:bifunctional non-homologous end joining protein LigD